MRYAKVQAVPAFLIVANSISWFMLTLILVVQRLATASQLETFAISLAYFGGLILTAVIGATLLRKSLLKKQSLLLWNLFGIFSCLISYLFYSQTDLVSQCILSFILSCSIGLGIPACLSLFSHQTKTENRGRFGAFIFFIIQIVTALILLPLSGATGDVQFLGLAIWRLMGLVGLLFYTAPEIPVTQQKVPQQNTSLTSIIKKRTFLLLFLPWFMFTIINYIETPVIELYMGAEYENYVLITNVVSSLSALVGGFLCDLKGRKIAGILGFVFLGVGYAMLSVFTDFARTRINFYLVHVF